MGIFTVNREGYGFSHTAQHSFVYNCHPERRKAIREATRLAHSKDPYQFNISKILAGNSYHGARD